MKRLTAFVLMVLIVVNACAFTIFAQSDIIIKGERNTYEFEYQKDDVFSVTFLIENNSKVTNGDFQVTYDPNIIQVVDCDKTFDDEYFGFSEGGEFYPFVKVAVINDAINFIPQVGNTVYSSADGVKSLSELGVFRYSTVTDNITPVTVKNSKLMTLNFKMVGLGKTTIKISPIYDGGDLLYNDGQPLTFSTSDITVNIVNSASLLVNSKNNTTTTTETTTTEEISETTTQELTNVIKKSFNDIENYPWAKNQIEILATNSIVNGVAEGKFNPSANVKRCDFLLMLMRVLEIDGQAQSSFDDVASDRYYSNAINLAKDLGITNGKGGNMFFPDEYITREDMMVFASNGIKAKIEIEKAENSVLDKFEDKSQISSYAVQPLADMVNAGFVNGTGNKIEPKANTTRVQAAVIIYNIYNALK